MPLAVVKRAKHCHAVTEDVQKMMVEILLARSARSCDSESDSDTYGSSNAGSTTTTSSSSSESGSSEAVSVTVDSTMQAQDPLHTGSNHPT